VGDGRHHGVETRAARLGGQSPVVDVAVGPGVEIWIVEDEGRPQRRLCAAPVNVSQEVDQREQGEETPGAWAVRGRLAAGQLFRRQQDRGALSRAQAVSQPYWS